MKNLVVVIAVVFMSSLGLKANASQLTDQLTNQVELSMYQADEKPCPADCTCDKCKAKDAKSADAKASDSKAADCSKKSDCKKSEKKAGCCAGAKAQTSTTETKESTDKK